jgi:hypothetical protein
VNDKKLWYPFYVIAHPFDGFYEVRHREKGSVWVALLLILLFGISFTLNRRYASFVVSDVNPLTVQSFTEIFGVLITALLFATANWSVTCLMDGEGRFRDILTVVGYSLLPLVLTFLPATGISWFIAADEESIYYLIKGVAVLFTVVLLLIGIMTVHGYSFGKTILTIFLTFVALILIIFIILLMVYLINQVWGFFDSIYTELILRA